MARFRDEDSLVSEINRYFPHLAGAGLRLGMGDDTALWRPKPKFETILTSDWFLEGTHFLREKHPPDSIGWKCLARAVSDVAAMGGTPRCFLLNLALPGSMPSRWLAGFLGGLHRASKSLRCTLAGGDTTRNERILISVTVIGEIPSGRAVLRSGAQAGDILYVSGRLGEAEVGWRKLRQNRGMPPSSRIEIRKHLYPEPRLKLGKWLAGNRLPNAMMDLSDGLSSDLPRLCKASGVGARVELSRLPIVPSLDLKTSRLMALNGGDDYELLFAVSPRKAAAIPASFGNLRLTQIGYLTKGRGIELVRENGSRRLLSSAGWDPFRGAK
jgi:thiamine-monophosphate kinase